MKANLQDVSHLQLEAHFPADDEWISSLSVRNNHKNDGKKEKKKKAIKISSKQSARISRPLK